MIRRSLPALGLALILLLPLAALAQTPAKPADAEAPAKTDDAKPAPPRARIKTSLGEITVELNPDKAPKTVENFVEYAREGFYDGTIFHRVEEGFVIQGGGFTPDLRRKPTRAPVQNEANNGLSNRRGTLAMARRLANANSAAAEFFINVVDNRNLDYVSDQSPMTSGYAVFGKVVEGMDVVDAIRATPTSAQAPFRANVPVTPVVIEKVEILD